MTDRIHPESLRDLKALVLLHGSTAIIKAVKEIASEYRRAIETQARTGEMKK